MGSNLIVCVPLGLRDALTIAVESTSLFELGNNESQRVDELHLIDETQTTDGVKKRGEVDSVVVVFDEKKRSFVSRDAVSQTSLVKQFSQFMHLIKRGIFL